MLKSFKLLSIFLLTFTSSLYLTAQDDVKFKEVLLNRKPAKLNLLTGEVKLVKLSDQSNTNNIDSIKVIPIAITKTETSFKKLDSTKLESDYYIVKDGDNLFKISVKFQTSINELKKANNLSTTLIKKGQKLRIRNFNIVAEKPSIWVVKKGDNLYQIAIKNRTTVESIKKINGLTSNLIKIGQKLLLK